MQVLKKHQKIYNTGRLENFGSKTARSDAATILRESKRLAKLNIREVAEFLPFVIERDNIGRLIGEEQANLK